MISAGMPSVTDLRRQYDALNDDKDRLDGRAQTVRGEYDDAAEAYNEAQRERVTAGQEVNEFDQRVRAANDGVRQATETEDSFVQNLSAERDKLVPERTSISGLFDVARFSDYMNIRDRRNAWELFGIQGECEDRNFPGAAILAFFKACLKMSAAMIGVSSPGPVTLDTPSYRRVADIPRNQAPEQFARAEAEARGLKAREEALHKKGENEGKYYKDLVAKKKDQFEEERSRQAGAVSERDAAQNEENKLDKKRKDARVAFNTASDAARAEASKVRKKGEEYDEAIRAQSGKKTA